MRACTIVDASIIAAASSIKHAKDERHVDIKQTKNDDQKWQSPGSLGGHVDMLQPGPDWHFSAISVFRSMSLR